MHSASTVPPFSVDAEYKASGPLLASPPGSWQHSETPRLTSRGSAGGAAVAIATPTGTQLHTPSAAVVLEQVQSTWSGLNVRECERGLVRCTKQLRALVALVPSTFTPLAAAALPADHPVSGVSLGSTRVESGASAERRGADASEDNDEVDAAFTGLSRTIDGYLGGGGLDPIPGVYSGEHGVAGHNNSNNNSSSSSQAGHRSGSAGSAAGSGLSHSSGGGGAGGGFSTGSVDALGQCALRYVWFWATKRKKLTSALAQVGTWRRV